MIFCLAFATQGTLDGSTAYVVGATTDEQRPYGIAVSNMAAGLVGIAMALTAGTIAHYRGAILAILTMGALNLASAVYAMTLRNVHPGETPAPGSGG